MKSLLVQQALAEGFSDIRICRPSDIPDAADRLQSFVDAGFHGDMEWMKKRMAWRGNPSALWPEARSVIMLAENYGPEHDPLDVHQQADRGAISVYAQGRDYHDVVKKRLKRLGRWLIAQNNETEIKVFVDTAPVMEKPLGQAAGLGWQGKHTNLVSRQLGSWFFIGSIFTNLEIAPDEMEEDHCGSCRSCLDSCPTDAFIAPYQMDARRCISYLTIEYSGAVAPELREKLGNRIYGCDDCLAVCPWNKYARKAQEIEYHARAGMVAPSLAQLAKLDDLAFREMFSKSAVKRIGRNRFVRNVMYAVGNSADLKLLPAANRLVEDSDEVVRDAARWAVQRINGKNRV